MRPAAIPHDSHNIASADLHREPEGVPRRIEGGRWIIGRQGIDDRPVQGVAEGGVDPLDRGPEGRLAAEECAGGGMTEAAPVTEIEDRSVSKPGVPMSGDGGNMW